MSIELKICPNIEVIKKPQSCEQLWGFYVYTIVISSRYLNHQMLAFQLESAFCALS